MLETPKTVSVLKLPVHLLNNYSHWLREQISQKRGTHVITLNAEMAMLAEQEPNVAQIIREADLVIPDGAGIVIYLKLRGYQQQRCPGIELAESLLKNLKNNELVAFYGGKPSVIEKAAQIWQEKVPNFSLLFNHGYLSPKEEEQWLQELEKKQPQLILVGLGVPRQEFWIAQHRYLCPHATWMGVGGSFDIWSGTKTRAPKWLREKHLEWLYRLYQEPWRWRRMLALPRFFWRSLLPF